MQPLCAWLAYPVTNNGIGLATPGTFRGQKIYEIFGRIDMAFATAVFKAQMISRVRGAVFIAVANKDAVAGSDQVQQVDDFCFIDGIGKYCTGESQ